MPDKNSLIELSLFSKNKITDLFQKCIQLKKQFHSNPISGSNLKGVAALLFFEPSTRTRFSFEAACVRAGIHPMVISTSNGTSLEKGETMEDTVLNLEAIRPLFFVIRCSESLDLNDLRKKVSIPILNAGWGMKGHPTQTLLDAVTLFEKWGSLQNKKILFVGDIKHSRVVSSHLELSEIMGYKIGYCSPQELLPVSFDRQHITYFDQLESGLRWADAVVALRVQKERHQGVHSDDFMIQYINNFGLNLKKLESFKKDGLILHPGPINYGVELEKEVLIDQRSVILQLVENGAFMRETLIREILK
jgi:aspartate carbamoyltransferase catalytic subunit